MKKNLGKIIILYLICINYIFANSDFSYQFNIPNNIDANIKEPIYLEFKVKQLAYDGKIIFFKFNIKENKNLDIHFLKLDEVNKPNNKHLTYSYLIYPKQSGKQKLEFTLFVQKTNEEGLKPGYEGDRDNVLAMVSKDSYIKITPLNIDVEYSKNEKKLYGDFKLDFQIDKQTVKPYEPVYISYTLSGNGFDPKIDDLFKDIKNLEYFVNIENKEVLHTENGTKINYKYKYAFISSEDFTIPSLKLDTLTAPKFDIKIEPIIKDTLIDKTIVPSSAKQSQEDYIEYLLYILIFTGGYITSTIVWINKSKIIKDTDEIVERPENIKDEKQRLLWMIKTNKELYKKEIEQLSSKLF